MQPGEDLGHLLDLDPAQLDILSSGQVDRIAAEVARNPGDRAQLAARDDAVGQPQAHHKEPRRLLTMEQTIPLHALKIVGRDRLKAIARVAIDIGQNIQTVFHGLDLFDGLLRHEIPPPAIADCRLQIAD